MRYIHPSDVFSTVNKYLAAAQLAYSQGDREAFRQAMARLEAAASDAVAEFANRHFGPLQGGPTDTPL